MHTCLHPSGSPVIVSELTQRGEAKQMAAVGPVPTALPHLAQRK
jgi:hypothetical protein